MSIRQAIAWREEACGVCGAFVARSDASSPRRKRLRGVNHDAHSRVRVGVPCVAAADHITSFTQSRATMWCCLNMKTPNTINGFQNNSSFSEAFSTKIQAAGVEPVMKPTRPTERDEDKAAILEQRKSAVDFWSTPSPAL